MGYSLLYNLIFWACTKIPRVISVSLWFSETIWFVGQPSSWCGPQIRKYDRRRNEKGEYPLYVLVPIHKDLRNQILKVSLDLLQFSMLTPRHVTFYIRSCLHT